MKNKNAISSNQLIFFTVASQVGVGIIFLPAQLAEIAGHDGWISVLIAGILFSFFILIVAAFMNRYKKKSIVEINRLLYGTYLGSIINVCLAAYTIIFSAAILRMMVEAMQLMGLKYTPRIVLTVFLIIPSIYTINGGLKVICRYLHITVFIGVILAIYIVLILGRIRPTYLMPLGEAGAKSIFNGVWTSIFAFLGIELIPFIYCEVNDKNHVVKKVLIGNLISIIIYISVVISTTGLFGEEMIKNLQIPLLSLARVCYSNIFERLDLYFVTTWVMAMGCVLRCYLFSGYYGAINAFNIKTRKWVVALIIIVLVCVISLEPREFIYLKERTKALGWIGFSVIVFYIFSYILSFINKRGVSR